MGGTLRSNGSAGAPRLHLDEHEGGAVQRDDVELAGGETDVSSDDPPSGLLEPGSDQLLGPSAEALTREGHGKAGCAARAPGVRGNRNGSVATM